MKNNIIIMIIVAVVFGGGGFFAGTKYQQSKVPSRGQFANGQFQRQGTRGGFQPVSGEIIKSDEQSVTVKLNDGSTKIVFLTDKTTINQSSGGSKDDLQTGVKVAIFGTQNDDGSVSAQSVQINPIDREVILNGGK